MNILSEVGYCHAIKRKVLEADSPSVIMGIGIPGSGKSTALEHVRHSLSPASELIDADAIRERLVKLRAPQPDTYRLMQVDIVRQTERALEKGKTAIIDTTNVEARQRLDTIRTITALGRCSFGAVYMDTPSEVALERNSQRQVPIVPSTIHSMSNLLQQRLPVIDEGYDWLLRITPDEYEHITHV